MRYVPSTFLPILCALAVLVAVVSVPSQVRAHLDPGPKVEVTFPQPHYFETNGAALEADAFPLQVVTVGEPPEGISSDAWGSLVQTSVSEWSRVPCSFAELEYAGHRASDDDLDADEIPIVTSTDHVCAPEGLVAWTTFTPCGGFPSRTIFINDADFEWTVEPRPFQQLDAQGKARIIDVESAITHELGHVIGLSHPDDRLATMHASYRPDGSMRSLALDDKLGVCSLYTAASPTPECTEERPCPDPESCVDVSSFQLCQEFRGRVGDQCGLDHLVCEQRCALEDEQTGYCTARCESAEECPDAFQCVDGFLEGVDGAYCSKIDPQEPPRGCCATSTNERPDGRALVFVLLLGISVIVRGRPR